MDLLLRRNLVTGLSVLLLAAAVFAQNPKTYGTATPGSKGLKPTVTISSAPQINDSTFALTVSNGRPNAVALVFVSGVKANKTIQGAQVLLDLAQAIRLPAIMLDKNGEGVLDLPFPDDPDAVGIILNAQAFIDDPGAKGGISATAGLTATILNKPSVLPIEVIGAEGLIETVHLDLGSKFKNATGLWLQANNLSHDGKASIRVNKGSWIDLKNSSTAVQIAEPDKSYGGIGGGFNSIRLNVKVPTSDFKAGLNTIAFRFNTSKDKTIGYRVLDLEVQDSKGVDLLAANTFEIDDPATWKPPLNNTKDIAAGADLWFGKTQKLTNHYGKNSRKIVASCSDCHARDGLDLKYYNYSNHSIIERSKFHGFSSKQSQQVASYIRSLKVVVPKNARPWNPPFQPGPGTDAKPAAEWAAGAGLDAVLSNDKAMLKPMFGTGSSSDIDKTTNVKGKLNIRDMAVAVQFPDWKHWLPEVHPVDIWGRAYFDSGAAMVQYNALRGTLDKGTPGNLVATFGKLQEQLTNFLRSGVIWGASWTTDWGSNTPAIIARDKRYSIEYTKYNLALWGAVKQWELVQSYKLYDKATGPNAEARQFPSTRFTTFHIAPHFIGDDRETSHFKWQTQVEGTYMSSIWYQVQLTLNPGLKLGDAVEPVDWTYNYQHILLLGERTGVLEPLRYFQNLIKGYQQRDRGVVNGGGWNMREVSPWRLYSNYNGDQRTHKLLNSYTTDGKLRARVTDSMLGQFLRVAESIPAKDWPTAKVGEGILTYWYSLEFPTYVPVLDPAKNVLPHKNLFARNGSYSAVEADAMARLLDKRLEAIGVDCKLQQRLGKWAKQFWPKHDWTVICK